MGRRADARTTAAFNGNDPDYYRVFNYIMRTDPNNPFAVHRYSPDFEKAYVPAPASDDSPEPEVPWDMAMTHVQSKCYCCVSIH